MFGIYACRFDGISHAKTQTGNFINYILFICSHTKHGSISKCIGRSFRSMGEMKKIRTLTHTQAYKKNGTLFLSFLKHAKIFRCWVFSVLAFLSSTRSFSFVFISVLYLCSAQKPGNMRISIQMPTYSHIISIPTWFVLPSTMTLDNMSALSKSLRYP